MAAEGNNNQPPPIPNPNPNTAVSTAGMSPTRTTSPPWNQIVSENGGAGGVDNNAKKPLAWNKKPTTSSINGDSAVSASAAVVMGAEQWPSLSECTSKSSPKLSSSSSDSSIIVSDFGSTFSPQVSGINTSSSTTVSLGARLQSSASQKSVSSSSNQLMTSNHARPARQKSIKRDGGGNPQSNGILSHQSVQSAGEGAHNQHSHGSPKPNSGRSSESSGTDNVQNQSHKDSGPRSASGEHHHHQRNSFRRGNGGPHPRGDGSHQNYGGRRNDQERGNHDFNHQRSFNGREMQARGAPRALVVAPPASAPFAYAPPLVPSFLNPPVSGVFVPPFPPVFYPVPGPELYSELVKQINYYFSVENLVRDTYLREHMDENGWVHVDLISKFNRVSILTNDTYQILEAVRSSTVVEVEGEKIRRRDDWKKWVIPPSVQFPASSGSQSPKGPSVPAVTNHTQNLSLDDKINHRSNAKDQIDGSAATLQASSGDSKSTLKTIANQANPGGC
ncbi:hypothetical protein KSS87_023297 [Heliosperma pusillum]|nr:hypothetical protein KSS87_023297 [Heliosperma pusillum]